MTTKKLFRMGIITCLLSLTVVACSSSDDDDNNNNGNNNTSNGEFKDPATGVINYRAALLPLVAGSYSGDCTQFPEGSRSTSPISIASNGDVTAASATGSLTNSHMNLTFKRKMDVNGQLQEASFQGLDINANDGISTNIKTGANEEDNVASVREGIGTSPGITCAKSPEAANLKNKTFFPRLSPYMQFNDRELNCVAVGSAEKMNFKLSGDQATIGNETFSFTNNVQEENVAVLSADQSLAYQVKTTDSRQISMKLDQKGGLTALDFKDKDGKTFACLP